MIEMDFYGVGKCMCYIYEGSIPSGTFLMMSLHVGSSRKNMMAHILSV